MKKFLLSLLATVILPATVSAAAPGLTIDDAISTPPSGKVTKLSRDGDAIYSVWGQMNRADYLSVASELVECDNGDVYLKDPVSQLPTGLYIKGHKEGQKLVFDLPQVAYLESY